MVQEIIKRNVDYRDALREILLRKIKQNPRYSLRAFARDLGIAPSRLSEIINKKQGLSLAAAQRMTKRLKLTDDLADLFCDSAAALHSRSPTARRIAEIKLVTKYKDSGACLKIAGDALGTQTDWYHLGILELMKVRQFREDPRWIAGQLKISPNQAELAIDRLINLNLIARVGGKLMAMTLTATNMPTGPAEAALELHHQMMPHGSKDGAAYHRSEVPEVAATILTGMARDERAAPSNQIMQRKAHFCRSRENGLTTNNLYSLALQFFSAPDRAGTVTTPVLKNMEASGAFTA